MNKKVGCIVLIALLGTVFGYGENELPDDYLPFSFRVRNGELAGNSEYLEGFTFSMNLPPDFLESPFDREKLFSIVREQNITGTLTYPDDRTSEIEYEIVNYRGFEDIYMKTTLGYFLWEMLEVRDRELSFAIYWWYCPPARMVDLEALEMAAELLGDSTRWHKMDDRKCEDDIESDKWSLFCAIKYASIQTMGEYNHHNTAMQALRSAIDEFAPGHGFAHTLMDFNNLPSTTHHDILYVIEIAKEKIEEELKNRPRLR